LNKIIYVLLAYFRLKIDLGGIFTVIGIVAIGYLFINDIRESRKQ